jgi:hypothetical protein
MARGDGVSRAAVVLLAVGIVLVSGCQQGHRPDTAAVPSGPASGAVGVSCTFSSSAEDHDGDDVAIRFDWGDGDTSEWALWCRPGETVRRTHAWATSGTFNIKAQAKARNFTFADWSDAHSLVIATSWVRTFGGTDADEGRAVQQTQDGGYIVTGYTASYGAGRMDVWLVKTDANGDTVWTRTFGGPRDDCGNSVQQTQDGGYIIAGCTGFLGGNTGDVWFIKADAYGDTVWTRSYGGSGPDEGYSVQQTQDGGYVIAGYTWSGSADYDIWLIKTDAAGNKTWERAFGGASDDEAFSVQQTKDGGYIIAGTIGSHGAGYYDVWLIKTDAEGNVDEGQGKDEFRIQKSETIDQSAEVRRVSLPSP